MTEAAIDKVGLSIVIPVLNESGVIEAALYHLQRLREQGCELIVVDGGSADNTVALAQPLADRVVVSTKGRALQMNAGADHAAGQWLLFLHVDTYMPEGLAGFLHALQNLDLDWGFFPLRLSGGHFLFRLIERAINIRSRLTSVATGDQCLFIRRSTFNASGQFPAIPLMEDVALSKSLRKQSRPFIGPVPVVTSSRRWEKKGIVKTVLLMWMLRLQFFLGVSPQRLFKRYYNH
ncbi:MAG: TIGR04283 family arsenosugar biosynthesis glycosyltransferase [Spongiibacteraceae bacterium]